MFGVEENYLMELKRISAADNSSLMKIKQNKFCIKKWGP